MDAPQSLPGSRSARRVHLTHCIACAVAIGTLQAILALPASGADDWPRNQVPTYQERQAFAAQMERYEQDNAWRARNRQAAAGRHADRSALAEWFAAGYTNGTTHAPQGPAFVRVAPPAKAARRAPTRKINRPLDRPPGQAIRRIGK